MNDRMRFVTYRIKCFLWIIGDSEGPHPGFGFAADISETGLGIYANVKLTVGTPVRFTLEEEDATPFTATVAWCQRYTLEQKFHGHQSYDHRLGLRLTFASEGEQQRYLMYFNELKRRVMLISKEPLF